MLYKTVMLIVKFLFVFALLEASSVPDSKSSIETAIGNLSVSVKLL